MHNVVHEYVISKRNEIIEEFYVYKKEKKSKKVKKGGNKKTDLYPDSCTRNGKIRDEVYIYI